MFYTHTTCTFGIIPFTAGDPAPRIPAPPFEIGVLVIWGLFHREGEVLLLGVGVIEPSESTTTFK